MPTAPFALLPADEALALINADGVPVRGSTLAMPDPSMLLQLYAAMAIGRRFDAQATIFTKQGAMAVYPSSRGQEACQVGAAMAMRPADWLFPTYRDSVAVLTRRVDPLQVLSLFRGDAHCGYDPYERNVSPQCTPLATNALHAVGLAHAATRAGEQTVAVAMLGDGATSEGDTHEALNFAAVWHAPVVFLIQNNGWAISVPTSKQSVAPSLAHKGIGYGIASIKVDGNDVAAVYAVVSQAIATAAAGGGPTLIEALTYRIESHTNADDASRYRSAADVAHWLKRDPLLRLRTYLFESGALSESAENEITQQADDLVAELRVRMAEPIVADPAQLFRHVYVRPTALLLEQSALLSEWM